MTELYLKIMEKLCKLYGVDYIYAYSHECRGNQYLNSKK